MNIKKALIQLCLLSALLLLNVDARAQSSAVFTSLHSFEIYTNGAYPLGTLIQGSDGNFYGTTSGGGTNGGYGTVFEITTNGTLTMLHAFSGNDGANPYGSLVQGSDGNFYGTTSRGGPNSDHGTVFKISASGAFISLHSFTAYDGRTPKAGLVQGLDGNLYGTTETGGSNFYGNVFKISPNGTLTSIYSFSAVKYNGHGSYTNLDGGAPRTALTLGSDGNFYGTTYYGGTNGSGTIFKITPAGVLTSLYSFTGSDGAYPSGTLVQGSDGNLYGTTSGGGTNDWGTIFKITTNGVFSSSYAFNYNLGANPGAGLVQDSSGNFYGTTYGGGFGLGTVFKISTNGILTDLYSFTSSNDGVNPLTGLVQGSDGNFYGTTEYGSIVASGSGGTVFKISAGGTFTNLYAFTVGGNDGNYPQAALVQGSDGNFYGTTENGGTNDWGTIFKISTSGSFTSLYSFTGDNDGGNPDAGLIQGSDGNFYGTTEYGGTNGSGTIFKITPAGVFASLYSFTNGDDGAYPTAALVQGSDGNFYGTTENGGTNSWGTIFKIITSGSFTSLYSFTGDNDGGNPDAGLIQGSDGNFYGTTEYGGTNGSGTIFKITPAGVFASLYTFTGGNDGDYPLAALVQGSDGNFYGTTEYGGTNDWGTIFKISTSGSFTSLYSFTGGSDGGNPNADLLQGSDGNFYGTTDGGGTNGYGTVFEISPDGLLTPLYSFTGGNDGGNPDAGLLQGFDGSFYGTTSAGGIGGNGTVFSLSTGLTGNPIARFTASLTNGTPPVTVQFNSPNVDILDNPIVSWNWIFGDGATSTVQNPSHTYTIAGAFAPTLIATNNQGREVVGIGPQIIVTSPASSGNPSAQSLWSERIASAISLAGAGKNGNNGEPNIGLALDANDNCYITGWFNGTNNFGGVTLTNQSMEGGSDIFVAKYNSTGALQWVRQAGETTNQNNGRAVGVDTNGNIYADGGYYGAAAFGGLAFPPFEQTLPAPPSGLQGFFLAKYNNSGALQWVTNAVGVYDEIYGIGMTVDGAGNSYALAFDDGDDGEIIHFGSVNVSIPEDYDSSTVLVKYDSNGNAQWAVLMGGGGEVYATKVAVDSAGNVYVHGLFEDTLTIGTSNLTLSAGSSEDTFVAKFSSSGTLLWIQQPQGDSNEGGVAVDSAGNVFVSGSLKNTLNFGNGIILTNLAPGTSFGDAFVAEYNSAGAIQWAEEAGGTNGAFYWDVALDGQDNVYPAGFYGINAAVAKYSSSGALQWTYAASGPTASPVASLVGKCAVDAAGNCFLDGWYQGTVTFGTNTLQPQETWNFFLTEVAHFAGSLPQMTIIHSGGHLVLTWPTNTVGFTLQSTTNLSPAVWSTVSSEPAIVNGQNTVTNSMTGLQMFYRLSQ